MSIVEELLRASIDYRCSLDDLAHLLQETERFDPLAAPERAKDLADKIAQHAHALVLCAAYLAKE